MKTKNSSNNKQQHENGFTKSSQMNGKTSTQQHSAVQTNGIKCLEQKHVNGHTVSNALTNGSHKNNGNANTTTTTTMNNKHSVDVNSLSSSSSSLLTPQAYLPKYVEKSFR